MTDLLLKLIDLVVSWFWYLMPFAVLGDDQVGLIRRFGKFKRYMRPGLNWKWPIIETPMAECSALDSTTLREQSLTTKDNVAVTVRGIIAYRVVDPRAYILGTATAISVMNDVGCCVIAEVIPLFDANDVLLGENFQRELTRKVKARAKRWGVAVESVGLAERVAAPVYRLITGNHRSGSDASGELT